jgi:hypothetical protein
MKAESGIEQMSARRSAAFQVHERLRRTEEKVRESRFQAGREDDRFPETKPESLTADQLVPDYKPSDGPRLMASGRDVMYLTSESMQTMAAPDPEELMSRDARTTDDSTMTSQGDIDHDSEDVIQGCLLSRKSIFHGARPAARVESPIMGLEPRVPCRRSPSTMMDPSIHRFD